jgi:hypothetical protein
MISKVSNMNLNWIHFKKIGIIPSSCSRFPGKSLGIFPNFFYSINLSVDKVYNAKNIIWIATLYRKIGRKVTVDFTTLYFIYINFLFLLMKVQ